MDDLKQAFDIMAGKSLPLTRLWRYYDGDHPIAFTNNKLHEVVPNGVVFSKNYCQVVCNATRDRLNIQTFDYTAEGEDDAIEEAMKRLWSGVLRKVATPAHISTLVTGEGYVIAWPDSIGAVKAYYHDPRQVVCLYDGEDPDLMTMAAKQWCANKKQYINLYYTDRIEHYEAPHAAQTSNAFQLVGTDANPSGVIPVFHFRLDARRETGELTQGVLSLQDAMNKLLNDMMVSSEYSAFPQRWGIGNWANGNVGVGAGTMALFPGSAQGDQPAAVGTFATTDPANYLTPIDNLAHSMAVLSATPKHFLTGASGEPSGEALQAMEAPLIAKVLGYQQVLSQTWADLMAFCLSVEGWWFVQARDLEVIWADPHTLQPYSQAQTRKTNTEAGIPIKNQLRDEGWTDEQLEQLEEDQQDQTMATTPQPSPVLMQRANIAPKPMTQDEAAPRFEDVVETPDMAGELARTGAIARAVK